ncbi:MAG: TonB family protein [Gammaproteobacteria bacterium]|nr:TonB family protein [Gammaproteobacteria bacterium]
MKARGYGLGIIASVAVHALALSLLALAWRADFQRREPASGNTPIPVWLVADKNPSPEDVASTAVQLPPSSAPALAAPPASPPPERQRAPEPVRESTPEPGTEPAVRHPAQTPPIPPATRVPEPPAQGEAPPQSRDEVSTEQPSAPASAPAGTGPMTGAPVEREYRALSRPEPAYPSRALARGIEGYVVLEFTVTAAGTTRDLRVLEASPRNVFDAAALAAAREFRYQPRIQGGAPVDVPGVRSRIRFQIRPR